MSKDLDRKQTGVYCKKDRTFYYLETGAIHLSNTTSRVISTLKSRGLIVQTTDTKGDYELFEIMTIGEAIDKEFAIKRIYLNHHVKKMLETGEENEKAQKRW